MCCLGKTQSAGNYLWRYKEEYEKVKTLKIPNWKELRAKGGKAASHENCGVPKKPVLQFTKDGKFVAEYPSTCEASRQTGNHNASISRCCKGKAKSCGGYIWRYKEEVE